MGRRNLGWKGKAAYKGIIIGSHLSHVRDMEEPVLHPEYTKPLKTLCKKGKYVLCICSVLQNFSNTILLEINLLVSIRTIFILLIQETKWGLKKVKICLRISEPKANILCIEMHLSFSTWLWAGNGKTLFWLSPIHTIDEEGFPSYGYGDGQTQYIQHKIDEIDSNLLVT